jgi:molybdopterin molybdotransferase
MLSVEEAQKLILSKSRQMSSETVALCDALGRTLAVEVQAPLDHPPWDTSAMDGYAVRSADFTDTPTSYRLIETILAGQMPTRPVGPHETSAIMTGAPMPAGADAVVEVELARREEEWLHFSVRPEVGRNIRYRAEALRSGDLLLSPGALLRPAEIGLLASLGQRDVDVFRRPTVAIVATGDELVEGGEVRGPGQIYNSNGPALAAQVSEAGAMPIALGIARDNEADLSLKLARALEADFVVVAGGVSVGEADFVKEVLEKLGVALKFWKIAMKPGYPLAFGTFNGRLVFGLPGNPVSAMVTFEQFVRPALLCAGGRRYFFRPTLSAILDEVILKKPGRRHFVRAVLSRVDGVDHVRLTGGQDSSHLMSVVRADGLMILPEARERFEPGETVQVQKWRDPETTSC